MLLAGEQGINTEDTAKPIYSKWIETKYLIYKYLRLFIFMLIRPNLIISKDERMSQQIKTNSN